MKPEATNQQPSLLQRMARQIPNYYAEMYLDGFTPTEILWSAHQTMISNLTHLSNDIEKPEVNLNVEV